MEKKTHRGCAQEIRRLKKANPSASNTLIAKAVGCSQANVSTVLTRFLGKHSQEELRDFQQSQPDILDALKMRTLESITTAKLAKASASSLATTFGILYDKSALQHGQATGMNVVVLMDVAQAIRAKRNQE